MKVIALYLYPVKGMGGIPVDQAKVCQEGFEYDRRWMLVDEEGTFLSQRSHPAMARFIPSITQSHLTINFAEDLIEIPLDQQDGTEDIAVKVFDDEMLAREVSPKVSSWFSEQLGKNIRLVKHISQTKRIKKLIKGPANTPVSFADGYPYLIVGTESLAELNRRLQTPLPMNRFRPNIVVDTKRAHEEDTWESVHIGLQHFMVIKPCARCQVTTVDQQTGVKGKEPLVTLATYRKVGNKVNFGANAISIGTGMVAVGDAVELDLD